MRRLLVIALLVVVLLAGHLWAQQQFSMAANFAADLEGEDDYREGCWGKAGAHAWRIRFKPPTGYRVRILRVSGDFLVWPVGKVQEGKFAGALLGLQTTAPEGSARCDLCADNTMLYVQTATGGQPARAAFDHQVAAGGLLEPDQVLVVKVAVWLNDTGRKIHMEPTFTVTYRWERQ